MSEITITFEYLRKEFSVADKERICLAEGEHPRCGPYLCQLAKGHEHGDNPRLIYHQAVCRKHHHCIISWPSK